MTLPIDWIDRLIEGRLGADERRLAETLLRTDETARRRYLEAMDMHVSMQWCFRGKGKAYQTLRPRAGSSSAWCAADDSFTPTLSRASRRSVWYAAEALAAAAAVLVVMAGYWYWPRATSDSPVAPVAPAIEQIVTLTDAQGALWSPTSRINETTAIGEAATMGEVGLEYGTAQLYFRDGALVTLCGPAKFIVTGPGSGRLEYGELMAHVPHPAAGFYIETPDHTRITDLGTEFVVRVSRDGTVRADVLEGRVTFDAAGRGEPLNMTAGMAASAAAGGRKLTSLVAEMNLRDRFQMTPGELYRQRILSDDPLAYWPLDGHEKPLGRAAIALEGMTKLTMSKGPTPDQKAADFADGQRLSGDPAALKLTGAISIEAWVKLNAQPHDELVQRLISIDGRSNGSVSAAGGWGLGFMDRHTVRFTQYGVRDMDFTDLNLPTGRWIFVALVYEAGGAARLYVDGEPQGWMIANTAPRYTDRVRLSIGAMSDGAEAFGQNAAHLAVYDRPLSQRQIDEHYRIGNPHP